MKFRWASVRFSLTLYFVAPYGTIFAFAHAASVYVNVTIEVTMYYTKLMRERIRSTANDFLTIGEKCFHIIFMLMEQTFSKIFSNNMRLHDLTEFHHPNTRRLLSRARQCNNPLNNNAYLTNNKNQAIHEKKISKLQLV